LPNIKWGLLYGVILCNARAMGEFGAVSVVSGHIRGQTNTMPLHVEILYNEYQSVAAFAVASLLALLALVTLAIKSFIEWRHAQEIQASANTPPDGRTDPFLAKFASFSPNRPVWAGNTKKSAYWSFLQ
jgi:sulfate transport system permease protein